MHGQKLGQWVERRESGGLALETPDAPAGSPAGWFSRHRVALVLCAVAAGLLTGFWFIRERVSYHAHVQSALQGEVREIRYEIHPGLWVKVTDKDLVAQITDWLTESQGGDTWGNAGTPANCEMQIHMADGRVHRLWVSPTGPFRGPEDALQANYFLAEIRWGGHRRTNYPHMGGISDIYRRVPRDARPDISLLPPMPLPPMATQPSTNPAATQPAR